MAMKLYKDVEIGDVIDGVKITDVEEEKENGQTDFLNDLAEG